jgi:pimeloyl-ACP methyl ester carboxylesterase
MARYVLVHGSYQGAWCWHRVATALRRAGHTVGAVDLPGSGSDTTPLETVTLDDYVARIGEVLRESDEPTILVGHSMGGIIITQAGSQHRSLVSQLVYVAAYLPEHGESLLSLTQLPEAAEDRVRDHVVIEGEPPMATLPPAVAAAAFYGQCTPEDAAWAVKQIGVQPFLPLLTPVDLDPSWNVRRRYIMTLRDRAIPPALQRLLAARGCDRVVSIDTDHSPFLSRANELTRALLEFANS